MSNPHCVPRGCRHPVPMGEKAYLPAFSRVARLQYDQGPGGDGGGSGSQALPLLLDEVVTEQPCLQDREQKGQVHKYSNGWMDRWYIEQIHCVFW